MLINGVTCVTFLMRIDSHLPPCTDAALPESARVIRKLLLIDARRKDWDMKDAIPQMS
jgi:hypothetical protein